MMAVDDIGRAGDDIGWLAGAADDIGYLTDFYCLAGAGDNVVCLTGPVCLPFIGCIASCLAILEAIVNVIEGSRAWLK